MPIVGDEYRQAVSDDPADRALEWYRNSKIYPDNPNLGTWGRINRAFQDGWVAGYTEGSAPSARIKTTSEREQDRRAQESLQEAFNDIFDELHTLKKGGIWTLLITTPDGHDSPNKLSVHINFEEARYSAEEDNTRYRQDHEAGIPIEWTDEPRGNASYGRGYLYCYQIERFDLPTYILEYGDGGEPRPATSASQGDAR